MFLLSVSIRLDRSHYVDSHIYLVSCDLYEVMRKSVRLANETLQKICTRLGHDPPNGLRLASNPFVGRS